MFEGKCVDIWCGYFSLGVGGGGEVSNLFPFLHSHMERPWLPYHLQRCLGFPPSVSPSPSPEDFEISGAGTKVAKPSKKVLKLDHMKLVLKQG